MRRLLIVGKQLPNFPNVAWKEWLTANPLDYQGLVLDCRDLAQLPAQGTIANYLQKYINIGHPVYIILPGSRVAEGQKGALAFVPTMHLYLYPGAGQTLRLNNSDPLFQAYIKALEGHEIYLQLQFATNQQPGWIEGIVDNVSRPICMKIFSIYLLHPPPARNEQKAFKTIIEHFSPDAPNVTALPKPSWVDEAAAKLPGVAEAMTARKTIQSEIEAQNERLRKQESELASLTGWADLLWLDGMPLQRKVGEALSFLGINAKSDDPTAHAGDLTADESNVHYVFEVTGSSGSIGIDKGRQLLQWVSEAPDLNTAKGVLVANAFRNQPPDKRPPTPDHRTFVTELEAFAKKYHLALLDTLELYSLVQLRLAGKSLDKTTVLAGLGTDGIVRFLVP